MYEIGTDPKTIYELEADDYGDKDLYEWCQKPDDESSRVNTIIRFLDVLEKAGAQTGKEIVETAEGDRETYFVIFSQDAKMGYFKAIYERFRRLTANMSLADFSLCSQFELTNLLGDVYGDLILDRDNDTYNNVDETIRNLELGVKYYIGNILYMY